MREQRCLGLALGLGCLLFAISSFATTTVLNFDSVSTSPFVGVDATSYFTAYGITISATTPLISLEIFSDCCSGVITPSSSPNFLLPIPGIGPLESLTLNFPQRLSSFTFTRTQFAVPANATGIFYGGFGTVAFNGNTQVGSTGEGSAIEFSTTPAATFTLNGPITSVTFNFTILPIGGLGTPPLDDFVLQTTSAVPEPGALSCLIIGLVALAGVFKKSFENSAIAP